MILPKDFCLISITLHLFTVVQNFISFKKFLRKRWMHFWLACWNSCCQKLHYVIAQNPELILKVWLFQKMLCIKIFFWTPWIQHWKPCWKRFTKSLTCFLLKLGEWWWNFFCQLKSPRTFFWTSRLRFSTLLKVSHSKKVEKAWECGFF